ncbi:Uncharacterised protein [uncultured archaeon]|nr:Uncharacterised protein [uncultured archaeon]
MLKYKFRLIFIMSYIIKNVSPEEWKRLKSKLPGIYEGIKKYFDENCSEQEKVAAVSLPVLDNEGGIKRLEIDGTRYSVKYNKKRQAMGIFVRKDGIEELVKNDMLLNSGEQSIVRELRESLGYQNTIIKILNLFPVDDSPTEMYGNPWIHRN